MFLYSYLIANIQLLLIYTTHYTTTYRVSYHYTFILITRWVPILQYILYICLTLFQRLVCVYPCLVCRRASIFAGVQYINLCITSARIIRGRVRLRYYNASYVFIRAFFYRRASTFPSNYRNVIFIYECAFLLPSQRLTVRAIRVRVFLPSCKRYRPTVVLYSLTISHTSPNLTCPWLCLSYDTIEKTTAVAV